MGRTYLFVLHHRQSVSRDAQASSGMRRKAFVADTAALVAF